MSSVGYLREFVNERLRAAAEEIFGVFQELVVEYEEEIGRQRRLLDIVWKPEIKLHRIELPQQHVLKEEEVLADQQLCIQEGNSSLDQEDPEPPQVKEEQEELCTSQEGEQLVLKQETDTFMLTATYEESDHSKPEPNTDHQLLSHNSHVAESQDQTGGKRGDSGSTRDAEPEPEPNDQHHISKTPSNDVCNANSLEIDRNTHTGKTFKCDTCGKAFKNRSKLHRHQNVHTSQKVYPCNTCGKRFSRGSALSSHIRVHKVKMQYSCKVCRKVFQNVSSLKIHLRVHTSEKLYSCNTCEKTFRQRGDLLNHMRRAHTGEKPYLCKTCGKEFTRSSDIIIHMRRAHAGEKPYLCKLVGKDSS